MTTRMRSIHFASAAFVAMMTAEAALATFTPYTDKAAWQNAVNSYTTITFQELPVGTNIVDHYADLGVHFTDGIDLVYQNNVFITDGVGMNGAFDSTTLEFDVPITSIGIDFPGSAKLKLYLDGVLIYTSPTFGFVGTGFFGGVVATQPFDKVVMSDDGLVVDNLYFGPPIPAPGALALLGVGGMMVGSRRRRP